MLLFMQQEKSMNKNVEERFCMDHKKNKAAIISIIGCIIIAIIYAAVLLKLVVFKNGFTANVRGINVIPFQFMIDLLSKHMRFTVFIKNVVGNIAVFVPLGIILSVLFSKIAVKKLIMRGFFVSLAIELIQLVFHLGICDIDDLITNTIGVIIGIALYWKLTRSWDLHWENSFASFLMLCFIGISSAILLFFFGYGNHIIQTPIVSVNEEILNGLDKNQAIEIICKNIEDSKLVGYQTIYDEKGRLQGNISVTYPVHDDTSYYLDTITSSYSINGNVTKVIVTYSKITREEYLELIQKQDVWTDVWTNDSNECYAVMATVHEG